jgi:sortase A
MAQGTNKRVTPGMQARFARFLEVSLLAIGLTLVAVFLALRIYGHVAGRVATWTLTAAADQGTTGGGVRAQPPEHGVDVSLWSRERIEAFKQSLAARFEAPIALLTIRTLSLEVPVFEGTEERVLNRGAGRIDGTAKPGEAGNIGIAAHRDGFFRSLKDIRIGDRIELKTADQTVKYAVDGLEIVVPEDVSVLSPRSRPALTLVTCYPFYFVGSAPKRFIVHASVAEPGGEPGTGERRSESETTKKREVMK